MMGLVLVVLGVGLFCALLATPMVIMMMRWLDAREVRPAPAPPAPEPAPTTPERIDQIPRRGRR